MANRWNTNASKIKIELVNALFCSLSIISSVIKGLLSTFGWGPVVYAIRGLQQEELDVVRRRDTAGQETEDYKTAGAHRHGPVKQTSHTNAVCITLYS